MKVIQQMVEYLEGHDRLKPAQLEELVAKGYWGVYTAGTPRSLENKIGQTFFFQVTGELHGALWGTDIYTSDSALGAACVHAGLLQSGESGVVKVKMVPALPIFQGSTRHGVTSHPWTTGWRAAYQVELFRK